MRFKKSNIIVSVICIAALSATSFYSGYAAGNSDSDIQYNSQGKIIFDNGTENTVDDVIFDASDFSTIDSLVTKGKTSIRDELNKYDSIDPIREDIPAFDTLAASIDALSDGTDATAGNILEGKTALVGKSIVTGSMDDHSGSKTNTDNIAENGTNAEITIPGGYYDEDSKISIPIDTLMKLPTINSNMLDYFEIPITLDAIWQFTASSSDNYAHSSVSFTLVYHNGELKTIGSTSTTATAPASRTSRATASVTVGELLN